MKKSYYLSMLIGIMLFIVLMQIVYLIHQNKHAGSIRIVYSVSIPYGCTLSTYEDINSTILDYVQKIDSSISPDQLNTSFVGSKFYISIPRINQDSKFYRMMGDDLSALVLCKDIVSNEASGKASISKGFSLVAAEYVPINNIRLIDVASLVINISIFSFFMLNRFKIRARQG